MLVSMKSCMALLGLSTTFASAEAKEINHGAALMDMLKTHGGKMHKQLEFRNQGPFYGMFAKKAIKEGQVLLEIPGAMVVSPFLPNSSPNLEVDDRVNVWFGPPHDDWFTGTVQYVSGQDDDEDFELRVRFDDGDFDVLGADAVWEKVTDDLDCGTVRRVLNENQLGADSKIKAYIDYLNSQPHGQVPAAWSQAGMDLFQEVLGHEHRQKKMGADFRDDSSRTLLPPQLDETAVVREEFLVRCGHLLASNEIETALNYYHLLNQRGWDELMIPVFDMMSHGNGRLLNTHHDSVRVNDDSREVASVIKVYASRDIAAGEEITTTYNLCANCENRFLGYGTPELLRDYGFVEGFPQRWFFHVQDIGFELDQPDGPGTDYQLEWLYEDRPNPRALEWLAEQHSRLQDLPQTFLQDKSLYDRYPQPMPQHEFDNLKRYQQALVVAIQQCLKAAGMEVDKPCGNADEDGFPQCQSSAKVYGTLDYVHPHDEPWVDDRPQVCKEGENGENHPYHTNEHRTLQIIESPYQTIEFMHNVDRNNDTCFQLDTVTQICTSYRPDYHEMVVHNTARYLQEPLKRVIFVGGGDSMLLHDVIKYPTLEKVVGLEIDQHVTRASFEHFGTEPHWDNPKVEWWFGDASKSLLMLPQDYFGSFDMVLVDLSETAASLSVTSHLNVMEALSLLLKPKGILVKNEYPYFPEQKNVFRDTLHIHYYDVPSVCSQSMILASNGIDFMRGSYVRNPDIDKVQLYKKLLDDPKMQYGYLHDYQKNNSNPIPYCTDEVKDENVQESSPGILMIIEAEDTTVDLSSLETVQKLMETAMTDSGFTVSKSYAPTEDITVTILGEGYVIARVYPEDAYVGFDFQLWSKFENQEAGKKALIEAMGSTFEGRSSSSYRVVTGGMFGVGTWKDDEKNRGPKLKNCDELEEVKSPKDFDQVETLDHVRIAVQESQGIITDEGDLVVAVLCGSESACSSVDALKADERVSQVVTLVACDGTDDYDVLPDGGRRMADCEIALWNTLKEAVDTSKGKIRSVVLDPSATEPLAKLMIRLMLSPVNKAIFFAENMTVTAPVIDFSDLWRRSFIERFRTHIYPDDPSHRAELYFNSTSTSFMVSLANSGDFNFGERLVEFVNKTEDRTQLTGEIDNIRGNTFEGFIISDPHIVNDNFTDSDFDQESQLEHWEAQLPLGFQVIFQFEITEKRAENMELEGTLKLFRRALQKTVVDDAETVQYNTFAEIGEGFLIMAVWPEGSAALLYDGRQHVDVNIFTYEEDFRAVYAFDKSMTECKSYTKKCTPGITRTLRDSQPRGKGRVVSFLVDLEGLDESGKPMKIPHWAPAEKKIS